MYIVDVIGISLNIPAQKDFLKPVLFSTSLKMHHAFVLVSKQLLISIFYFKYDKSNTHKMFFESKKAMMPTNEISEQ